MAERVKMYARGTEQHRLPNYTLESVLDSTLDSALPRDKAAPHTRETHTPAKDNSHTEEPVTIPASSSQSKTNFDPDVIWQMVLSELAMQMPAATYDTWVRDTFVLGYEDGEFIIGMPNAYARDWLQNRLRNTIKRTLSSIMHRSIEIQFRVHSSPRNAPAAMEMTPLYEAAIQPETVQLEDNNLVAPVMPGTEQRSVQDRTVQERSAQKTAPLDTLYGSRKKTRPMASTQSAARVDNTKRDSMPDRALFSTQLNPYHTFDTFVVGNHNRLAHAAALAIVDNPGQSFNPLFIYGGVGLGKTHLLNAIGNCIQASGYNLLYCTSEQFTNELISAIRAQNTEEFRNKYRQVDVLLIDDIQFIAGKESTQEEFFHTFNHLHAAGRQVVLSSDRPPKALPTLEERLRSRFEGGLQTDIGQPDFETRVAILQSKANRMGVPVPYDVLLLIAERVDSNIRELEGALNRLYLQARLSNSSVTLGFAKTLLENLAPQRVVCAPANVIEIVAHHFNLRAEDLTGRKRTKDIAHARQIAMYLLREENDLSLPAIGEQLGGRDHSTVRYGVEKIIGDLEGNEELRQSITTLREKIYTPTG